MKMNKPIKQKPKPLKTLTKEQIRESIQYTIKNDICYGIFKAPNNN